MRRLLMVVILGCGWAMLTTAVQAQPAPPAANPSADGLVKRLMEFNKKGDGKLTREEVTDERLLRLFDQIDVNHDGFVTKDKIQEFANKLAGQAANGPRRGNGPDGAGTGGPQGNPGQGPQSGRPAGPPNGQGGPQNGPPGEQSNGLQGGRPNGPGAGQPRPMPGQIIPGPLQDRLNLSAEQKTQLEALQKEVNEKLEKLFNEEQRRQWAEIRSRAQREPNGPPRDGNGPPPDQNGPPRDQNGPPPDQNGPPRGPNPPERNNPPPRRPMLESESK